MRPKLVDVVILVPFFRYDARRLYYFHHLLMVIILMISWINLSRSTPVTTTNNNVLDGFFNDVEYENQRWVFEMINIGPVWSKGIFGKGVRVRVNDGGIDENNIEFQNRYDKDSSCTKESTISNNNNNNDRLFDGDQHGTSVASIIGASANNGECAMGVAPETIISWCNGLQSDESFLDYRIDNFDISQNSFERDACRPIDQGDNKQRRGLRRLRPDDDFERCPFVVPGAIPCRVCNDFATGSTYYDTSYNGDNDNNEQLLTDECVKSIVTHCDRYFKREEREGTGACLDFLDLIIGGECSYDGLSTTARNSIVNGIRQGRNGKGIIYVFSSGNAYHEGDDTNLKGYTATRMTISVGAVGKDGTHTFYSTGGASLFLTAPGGDSDDQQKHIVAQAGGGCTSTYVGTSFAAPVVSGVVALMLETNPTLSWRDVQGILAESATKPPVLNNNSYDDTSVVNGGGLWHSNLYGFGIVNAGNAVDLSKIWINYGGEQLITTDSGPLNFPILDDPTVPTTSSLIISPGTSEETYFVVESIEILLDLVHISRGDLKVTLTSPSGISSILHPGKLPENIQLESDQFWKLMTVRNRDESPFGEWQLHISDEKAGQFQKCVDMANFVFYYDNVKVDCRYLEKNEMCSADVFLNKVSDDNGRTMSEACCICGGGLQRESFQDMLRHWTIAIYGRYDISRFATTTKKSPPGSSSTEVDTMTRTPTNAPSSLPTIAPSSLPTIAPSSLPSILPTTTSPSEFQSTTPPTLLSASSEPSSRPTVTASSPPDVLTSDAPLSPYPTTSIPSARPSLTRSNQPTIIALSDKSEVLSKQPSFQLSQSPSDHLSTTRSPNQFPTTDHPSILPSHLQVPSLTPSLLSTQQPSRHLPSVLPSIQPSSQFPNTEPTRMPSVPSDDPFTASSPTTLSPTVAYMPSSMIPSTILSSNQMLTSPEYPDTIDEATATATATATSTTNKTLTEIVIDDNSSSSSSDTYNNNVDLVEDGNGGISSILVVDDLRGDSGYDSTVTATSTTIASSSSSSSSSSAGCCSFRSTCRRSSLRQQQVWWWFSCYKPLSTSSLLVVAVSTAIATIAMMGF